MLNKLNNTIQRIAPPKRLTARTFDRIIFVIGFSSFAFLAIALAAPVFLPPIPPSWDADRTVQHYREHKKGIQASAACLLISGAAYSAGTAFISDELMHIPNLPRSAAMVQQTSGVGLGIFIQICGVILSTAAYRLDRSPEITQALNDLFWFMFLLPAPAFALQLFPIAWAALVDTRPKPYFPKYLAVVIILWIVISIPTLAMHVVYDGPLAWNGALNFWTVLGLLVVAEGIEWACIWRAISSQSETGQEELE